MGDLVASFGFALLMWWLRLRYAMGSDPRELARLYSSG